MKLFFDLPKISANQYYSGLHWSKRKAISDQYHSYIFYLVKKLQFPKIEKPCRFNFYFNNKFDLDNNFIMVKMIIDGFRYAGIIKDDSKKYIIGISVESANKDYLEIIERV